MKLRITAIIGFLSLFLASCASKRHAITGTFQLVDKDVARNGAVCSGTGGYSDVKEGLKVVVKNAGGTIIGLGALEPDSYKGEYPRVVCEFPFKVSDLPSSKFYSIEVGSRGSLEYTKEQLEKLGWQVSFSLGN